MERKKEKPSRAVPPISQETVDALSRTRTMEEFLAVAQTHRVDWNALPDEWLDAVAQGDVTDLIFRLKHKPKGGQK